MIRKYLVVNDQVTISTTRADDEKAETQVFDLFLPLEVYERILDLLKKADYMLSTRETAYVVDIQTTYREIFKLTAPWAISELNRATLYSKAAGKSTQVKPVIKTKT